VSSACSERGATCTSLHAYMYLYTPMPRVHVLVPRVHVHVLEHHLERTCNRDVADTDKQVLPAELQHARHNNPHRLPGNLRARHVKRCSYTHNNCLPSLRRCIGGPRHTPAAQLTAVLASGLTARICGMCHAWLRRGAVEAKSVPDNAHTRRRARKGRSRPVHCVTVRTPNRTDAPPLSGSWMGREDR
jgi:hypothetical protein